MRAVRQHELGGPEVLALEEVPDLEPEAGQVRIAVEISGVHLLDTVIRRGEHQVPTELPMTPGREVAGRVDAVGQGVGEEWWGRRVVVHLGMSSGGYAEQAVAAVDSLHEIPTVLTSGLAVAAIGTGRTATGILDIAPISSDDRVVVTAASGGLGALLVREALRLGARVVGMAGGPEKMRAVRRLGAVPVDSRSDGWEGELKDVWGDGAAPTVVYDGVGEPFTTPLYRMLESGGALVSYTGEPAGDGLDEADRRFVPVLGPAMLARPGGLRSLEAEALARAADGSRVPLVGAPFSDAVEAHRALEARHTIGKVLLDLRKRT